MSRQTGTLCTTTAFLMPLALAMALAACSADWVRWREPAPGDGAAMRQEHATSAGVGEQIAIFAERYVGTPYRFGGATPEEGFDCSGLVRYVHARVGLDLPREALEQFRAARPVTERDLAPGDLVFFRIDGNTVSHVGIYVGSGRFVHAPSEGGAVTYARLDEPYWRSRFVGAGRFGD
ncbi:MAG TPA: C40 family peptidase [Gammaproteobacteria bacterium]|nr:C40 family peptidase [Gammaproteobacteria bacterium]